jgi:hypothetical protein
VADERLGLAQQAQERARDGEHVELVLRADVERLALDARERQQREQRVAVIRRRAASRAC